MKFFLATGGKTTDIEFIPLGNDFYNRLTVMNEGIEIINWIVDNLSDDQYDGILVGLSRYHHQNFSKDIEKAIRNYQKAQA